MTPESTTGAALLAAVEALGWPVLGTSVEGRTIHGQLLVAPGANHTATPLMLMAGIHGDEGSSVAAVLAWLAAGGATRLASPTWVVPALNPDGLLKAQKNNARAVDLNRNFGSANWSPNHKPNYHPGAGPLSEPETALFAALINRVRPWAVAAIHAPFACINYDGPAAAWAEAVAQASGWPARADLGYPTPGSLGSWLGVDRGLPVLTVELPPGPFAPFAGPAVRAMEALAASPTSDRL